MTSFTFSLVGLVLSLLVTSCATLTAGTSQSILVDVLNVPGAQCRGVDSKGRTYVWVDTPSTTTVHKGDGPMTLICEKDGFKKTVMEFDEGITNATYGNILIGGGIGLAVDIASGAAQEYPSKVHLVMEPLEPASQSTQDEYEKWKTKLKTEAETAAKEKSCPENEVCE